MKAYFSHDEGARNDPKLIEVMLSLGHEGKSVYWDLVEMLYEQGGYLMLASVKAYAFSLHTKSDVVTSLINDFDLFANDGKKFWSETVLRRMNMRRGKSEARAQAGSKGGRIRAEREAAAKEKGTHTKEEWVELLEFCENQCACCGSTEQIQKDHITPIYQGGSDGIENLQPLCKKCNTSKGPVAQDYRLRFAKAKPNQIPSKLQALLEQSEATKVNENKEKEREEGNAGDPSVGPEKASPESQKNQTTEHPGGAAKPVKTRTYLPEYSPVFLRKSFFAYLDSIGYSHVDKGVYLLQIQAKATQRGGERTDEGWKDFIMSYLNNHKRDRMLILPESNDGPTQYRNPNNPAPTVTKMAGNIKAMIAAQAKNDYL